MLLRYFHKPWHSAYLYTKSFTNHKLSPIQIRAQSSSGIIEYTDCISSEWLDSPNGCFVYDTKQSDGEASVVLELWGMQSTPLFPFFEGLFCSGDIASDVVLSMSQIEPNYNHTILNCWKLTVLNLTACKQKAVHIF